MADLVQQNPVVPLDIQGIAIRKAALLEADQRQKDRAIEEQTAAEQRRILGEVAKTPLIQDPQTGQWVMDRNTLMQKFGGVIPKPLRDMFDEDDKHVSTVHAAQEAALSSGAKRVVASGNNPDIWKQNLDYWEKNHVLSSQEAANYRKVTDPKQIGVIASQLSGQKPGEGDFTLNSPGAPDARFRAGESTPYATGMAPAPKPDEPVYRVNPQKGNPELVGTVPAGAHLLQQPQPQQVTVNTGSGSDVAETVRGMKDGTLPPLLPGRGTKEYVALSAEAHRQGFDLASAATDWMATQKHISTLNGAQQTRINQAIGQLPELLDTVDDLASKWKAGRFPLLNKANLALAKGGAFGKDAASIANQLDAQIADVTADLGAVYMGGNSPTDHALGLAAKALDSSWDERVLHDMVALARKNVQTRHNSIRNTGVQGVGGDNPYAPNQTPRVDWVYDPVTKTFKKGGG